MAVIAEYVIPKDWQPWPGFDMKYNGAGAKVIVLDDAMVNETPEEIARHKRDLANAMLRIYSHLTPEELATVPEADHETI